MQQLQHKDYCACVIDMFPRGDRGNSKIFNSIWCCCEDVLELEEASMAEREYLIYCWDMLKYEPGNTEGKRNSNGYTYCPW
jgi:hypothetical protein